MADMAQETPEQRLARLLMQGGDTQQPAGNNQALADALMPPPRNPAMPADWAQNAVRGVAGKLADIVMAPRRAMDQGMTTEEAVPWAGDVAMGMAGASAPFAAPGALGAAGGKLVQPQGIHAYHASPHDFEKFDISKVNTGQGSQSYGHGIYVAENPAVSGRGGQYDQEFSRGLYSTKAGQIQPGQAFQELYDATPTNLHPDHRRAVVNAVLSGIDDKGSAAKYLRTIEAPAMHRDAYNAVGAKADEMGLGPGKAHIYEVNINAKPEQFLDWDKPFVEQPPQVQDAVQRLLGEVKPRSSDAARGYDIYDQAVTRGLDTRPSIYRDDRLLWDEMAKKKPIASSMLNEAGIPGIKYLDQGSRKTPEMVQALEAEIKKWEGGASQNPGDAARYLQQANDAKSRLAAMDSPTSNYVLFDDKLIDILRKYGLGGAAPSAAALAEALSRQPADSAK